MAGFRTAQQLFRSLTRRPGYHAAFVLNLAMAALLASGVYSLLDRVLLRPLPYPEPQRLISIWRMAQRPDTGAWRRTFISAPQFLAWEKRKQRFESAAAYYVRRQALIDGEVSREVLVAETTHRFFETLGSAPFLGRSFRPEEDEAAASPAAVLTYRLWQSAYNGDRGVLGRLIEVNRKPAVVVGVMPSDFRFYVRERPDLGSPPQETELFLSIGQRFSRLLPYPNWYHLRMVARLREPGVEGLPEELMRISEAEAKDDHSIGKSQIRLQTLLDEAVADVRKPLLILQAAAAVLFLIACVNLTNLILFRRVQLAESVAIRHALGAGRLRANGLILLEVAVLVPAAVILGLTAAHVLLSEFADLLPKQLVRLGEPASSWPSFLVIGAILGGIAWAVCILVIAVVGMPALGRSVLGGMKLAGSSVVQRLYSSAVVFQVTLATALLASSLLLLHSFRQLANVDPGFEVGNRYAVSLNIPSEVYWKGYRSNVLGLDLAERLSLRPFVRHVAFADSMPFLTPGMRSSFKIPGHEEQERPMADLRTVSASYFDTLGVKVVRGRAFSQADDASSPPVAIVNRAAVERFDWGPDPLGQEIAMRPETSLRVVGIVENTKLTALATSDEPIVYRPASQAKSILIDSLIIDTNPPAPGLGNLVVAEVRKLDPRIVVARVVPLRSLVSSSIHEPRFRAIVLSIFSLMSLSMVAVGLYGVQSQAVRRRRKEIAIRMANGAAPAVIFRLILRRGVGLVLLGLVLGSFSYLGIARLLRSFLFGVGSYDPVVLSVMAASVVLGVGCLASVVPALRARRTDPNALLRNEA